jgi:hypothetical protein
MSVEQVLLRDEDMNSARNMRNILGPNLPLLLFPKAGNPQAVWVTAVRYISCFTCGAMPEKRCVSKSGKPTRSHADREVAFLASVFAHENETVITEELDIEDLLSS